MIALMNYSESLFQKSNIIKIRIIRKIRRKMALFLRSISPEKSRSAVYSHSYRPAT